MREGSKKVGERKDGTSNRTKRSESQTEGRGSNECGGVEVRTQRG